MELASPARRARLRSVLSEALEKRYLMAGGIDRLVNNNVGADGTSHFTQSEASVVAFGSTVVVAFDDAGSFTSGSHVTGFSSSVDGGVGFTDGGTLPFSNGGDAGDALLARDETTGRIYLSTIGLNVSTNQVFRSDTNGATWLAPVVGTPGGSSEDVASLKVDNFAGTGRGNVYLASRRFGGAAGIYFYRSTNNGDSFSTGVFLVSGSPTNVQGPSIVVGPDHSIYAFWYINTGLIQMRKSTDLGLTFGATVTVASGLPTTINGDLGLTGIRNGVATPASFRTHAFPIAAVNPVNGNVYVTYDADGPGVDKADVFLVQSTTGGTSWSAPMKINDDATTTDQWQPTLAVTPDGTRLGVFYYSRQEDPTGNNLYRFYSRLANCSTANLAFSASSPVSDVDSLPEFGRDSIVNSVYMGDRNTVTATNDAFHVVWADNRSDLAGGAPRKDPNVYYDKISLAVTNGIWDGGGDGVNWSDSFNWSNNVLPGATDDVVINIAANPNIVINGARSVHSVTSSENLTINGTLSVATESTFGANVTMNTGGSLGGAGRIVIAGSIVMAGGMISGTASITVNAGAAIQFSAVGITRITRPLVINGTGAAFIGGNQLLVLTSLTFGPGASLNLTNNDIIINYSGPSPLAQIQAYINTARNGGSWNGAGLTSSTASLSGKTTLGAIEGSSYGANYGGEPLDGTAVLVKYTYYGDTDFNGIVNFDDYARIDVGFSTGRTGWINGDFDGNGTVNFDDYALIDLAFNTQGSPLLPAPAPGGGKGGWRRS